MAQMNPRQILRSGGVVIAGMGIRLGISFFVTVLAARYLGTTGFGAVAVGTTILIAVSLLSMLGLGQGVSSFLPRDSSTEHSNNVLSSAFQIVVPISILVGAILFLLAEPLAVLVFSDRQLTAILQVAALGIPVANVTRFAIATIRGKEKTLSKVLIDDFITYGSRLAFVVLFISMGLGATAIAGAYSLSFLVAAVVSVYYLVRFTPLFDTRGGSPMHRELLSFSLPLWIAAGTNIIYSSSDTLILSAFSSTSDVGIYNAIYSLGHHLSIVLVGLGYLALPAFSKYYAKGNISEMQTYYQTATQWIFVATLPLLLILVSFPRDIIVFLFGADYQGGALALVILALGFFIHAIAGPNSEALKAANQTRPLMTDQLLAGGLNIILNLLLIPQYSFFGAAIATTISYAFMNCLFSYHLYTHTRIHPITPYFLGLLGLTISGLGISLLFI